MRALGERSIASLVKAALDVARWLLWGGAFMLALVALAYLAVLGLTLAGVIDPALLTSMESNVKIGRGVEVSGAAARIAYLWYCALGAVWIGGGIVIVGHLRRLFTGFSSGEPFRREYADHLRAIWIAMMMVEIARAVLVVWRRVLVARFDDAAPHLGLQINLSTWISIFVLIVIAEVFREGARMREEQALTI